MTDVTLPDPAPPLRQCDEVGGPCRYPSICGARDLCFAWGVNYEFDSHAAATRQILEGIAPEDRGDEDD